MQGLPSRMGLLRAKVTAAFASVLPTGFHQPVHDFEHRELERFEAKFATAGAPTPRISISTNAPPAIYAGYSKLSAFSAARATSRRRSAIFSRRRREQHLHYRSALSDPRLLSAASWPLAGTLGRRAVKIWGVDYAELQYVAMD